MAKNFNHKRKLSQEQSQLVFDVLRAVRAHSTAELARESGLTSGCISKLRTRRTLSPKLSTAERLLEAVGAKLVVEERAERRADWRISPRHRLEASAPR